MDHHGDAYTSAGLMAYLQGVVLLLAAWLAGELAKYLPNRACANANTSFSHSSNPQSRMVWT